MFVHIFLERVSITIIKEIRDSSQLAFTECLVLIAFQVLSRLTLTTTPMK